MQKVITITTHTNVLKASDGPKASYAAIEYKEINSLLEDGYKVVSITPLADAGGTYRYTLTFVLEKS